MSLTWRIAVESPPPGHATWPARVSVPVPRGGSVPEGYLVEAPDGGIAYAASRALTHWPEGSPRWVQLDFPAGGAGDYVVHAVPEIAARRDLLDATASHLPVAKRQEDGRTIVEVGRLCVALDPAADAPVASILWNNRELIGDGWRFDVVDEAGQSFPLIGNPDAVVTIEADSPQRVQLMWETTHAQSLLAVRFRVEFLAGVEGFSLSYQFFHKTPGRIELQLRSMAADFPLAITGKAVIVQPCHSNLGLRRIVRAEHAITTHLDRSRFAPHVKQASELDDDFDYPSFLRGTELDTGSAVAVESDDVAVLFAMRDFEYQRPKTLTVKPDGFTVGIWPEAAGPLVLPQGRSTRQVFSLLFADPATVDSTLIAPAALRLEPTTAWLHNEDSAHAGATWDQSRLLDEAAPGAAFFSYLLRTATGRFETVPEMFHYGDTPDAGYTIAYPSTGRTPGERGDYRYAAGSHTLHGLAETCHTLPPVWSNNEYDAIYCLALEALRNRNAAVRHKLTAAARHQIEVDFVHYSDHWQQHRSTPQHSYDHVTMMSSIPSHQWTQGLYYYYALTGDDDVPEIVRAICDFNIAFIERDELSFSFSFNRELGWALVALVCGYELTGDGRYREFSVKIIHMLRGEAGRTDFAELDKKSATSPGLNASGIGIGFNQNTIPLGLKLYHQATGEQWAYNLLYEWVEFGMGNFNDRSTGVKLSELFPETFCYLCELSGDSKWLADSLWQLRMFMMGFNDLGWIDTGKPPLDTKHYTRIYRGLSFYLATLSKAGLLEAFEARLVDADDIRAGG